MTCSYSLNLMENLVLLIEHASLSVNFIVYKDHDPWLEVLVSLFFCSLFYVFLQLNNNVHKMFIQKIFRMN